MVTALSPIDLDNLPTMLDGDPKDVELATTLRDAKPRGGNVAELLRAAHSDPHVGRHIGNMVIIRKLAEGGMGSVYLAQDASNGQTLAVKILSPTLARNRNIMTRFFNEAKAAQSIEHPGVVRIFGADYDDQGNAYLVMEYLEGESLDQRLRRQGRLSVPETLSIARQIVSALAAAHDRGVVHRDLKPGNIFLTSDPSAPGGERVKLLDFGVAKLVAADKPLTSIGDIIGTPHYMAPEQCRADGNIDSRADLYALGCLIYAMLCGRTPFTGNHPGDIICAHLQAPVPPPRMFLPTISPDLEATLLSLLQKDPARRPQSAERVQAMIKAPVPQPCNDESTSKVAAPASPWRRTLVIGAAGLMTAAAGAIAFLAI